ncbi:MAG: alpha/beta fold hydrolase, partial [Actinomycetota bacterium]
GVLEWTLEHAQTDDGWNLALYRYDGGDRDLPPVILCGGYACNRYFFDFDARYSMARALARRGFDAWALELRGRGASHPARQSAPRAWTFDDLTLWDLPAAVRHVSNRTGRPPVWIGHSMGGMLGYAGLGLDERIAKSVAGLVTLASPVLFTPVSSSLAHLFGEGIISVATPVIPQRRALVGMWWLVRSSPRVLNVGMNADNIDRAAFGRALRRFICNVPKQKLHQFMRWQLHGTFASVDGLTDYQAGLRRITVPSLVVAGTVDRLAPPQSVRFAYEELASSHKTYREFGVKQGYSADYGHVDLVFGRNAPDEVFPAIADWIQNELPKE